MKRHFKDSPEYKRIIEIMDEYWQTEPGEELVTVSMYFKHHNGETQQKRIIWRNPKYEDKYTSGFKFVTAYELD